MNATMASLVADAVLVLHALFVAWVVAGALAVWCRPALAWAHLPAVAWGVWIEWSGGICPLTPLEWRLRAAAGQSPGTGGFVEHYVTAMLYPEGLSRELQWVLGGLVLVVNLAAYAWVWRHRAARRAMP